MISRMGWLPGWALQRLVRGTADVRDRLSGRFSPARPRRLILCVADHFEPGNADASEAVARRRLERWLHEYPRRFGDLRDSDGRPPRHTFFYPIDMYRPSELDGLGELCRAGFGEVEIHLHHDDDTSSNLRRTLLEFKARFAERHGQLARVRTPNPASTPETDRDRDRDHNVRYAFVHGNWALDNSRPDGRWCGVNDELDVLRETGCYADFTMPSAPSPTQTRTVNSIYRAVDDPRRPKSHDRGRPVRGPGSTPPERSLLIVQGPLMLDFGRRKWGVAPRLENADLLGNHPPSARRLRLWMKAAIRVPSRPDWFFVKLHTHGANDRNIDMLLGEPARRFHEDLARAAKDDPAFRYHYATAREVYNLIRAAEAGWQGSVEDARDFELVWNGGRGSDRGGPSTK